MNIKLDIPENFFRGEERCGYYVSPEMKKVWAVELDLLAEFARVCEKHNIKFYMDGGTLLGAVRHKGFIPWDDDVDILLMREDYNKLLEIAPNEFKQPYFFYTPTQSREGRIMTFSKLFNDSTTIFENANSKLFYDVNKPDSHFGIYIDVFPLDDIPDNDKLLQKIVKRLNKLLRNMSLIDKYKNSYKPSSIAWKRPIKAFMHYVYKIMNMSFKPYHDKIMNIIDSSSYPESKRLAKLCMFPDPKFFTRRVWNRSDFDETVYLSFEMFNLPAPAGWENILDKFYGNWRKYYIRAKHGAFYDTEHPYTYYTKEGHSIDDNSI
ncbi:MAG: LicD family protein [Synergistaceae bacterium]|nr:LicD family protein [Synergistaceae bacterium]